MARISHTGCQEAAGVPLVLQASAAAEARTMRFARRPCRSLSPPRQACSSSLSTASSPSAALFWPKPAGRAVGSGCGHETGLCKGEDGDYSRLLMSGTLKC